MTNVKRKDYICPKKDWCYNSNCYHRNPHKHDEFCNQPPTGEDGSCPCNDKRTFCIPYKPSLTTIIAKE